MNRDWIKNVLRSPEGEGGGGTEGGASTPDTSRIDAFESRINQMGNALNEFLTEQRSTKQRTDKENIERGITYRVREAEAEVTRLEAALAEAFDSGEGVQIAAAQRKLSEAVAKREQATQNLASYKAQMEAAERREGGSRGGGQETNTTLDTTNLTEWKSKHASWYGVDSDMTRAAHEIDGRIRSAGAIPVGSKEYFRAIDREMSNRFPDKFGGAPQTAGGSGSGAPNTPRKGRIAQSVVEGWRRMGINVNDPKVIERMMKNRDVAVQKGILPSEPVTGVVRS